MEDETTVIEEHGADLTPDVEADQAPEPAADKSFADQQSEIRSLWNHPAREEPAEKEEERDVAPADEAEQEEAPTPEQPAEDASPRAYAILDAEGKALDAGLPEGATVRFKADGREVVATLDEVVRHASMGVHADRRLSQMGQDVRAAKDAAGKHATALGQAEQMIEKLLTDPDYLDKVQARFERIADPEIRDALRAKQVLAERDEQDQVRQEAHEQAVYAQFWDSVSDQIKTAIPDYSHLRAEDEEEVRSAFYGLATQQYEELHGRYSEIARQRGFSAEEADAHAERDALAVLTEENLKWLMGQVNGRYASRLGSPPNLREERNGPAPTREMQAVRDEKGRFVSAEAEAEKHNNHVTEKLKQRDTNKMIRGGGAPPGAARMPERPETFDQHRAGVRQLWGRLSG